MMKLKALPNNPASNILRQCNPQNYMATRSSKPLPVRIGATVDPSILNQKIKEINCSKLPPWSTPEPIICKKTIVKRSSSEKVVKACFLDHDQIHLNSIKIYTDGSKTPNGVGFAIIHENSSYAGRLSNNASIFTAELTALKFSLEVISTIQGHHFTVYTDSYSALMAINQYNPQHPIVQQILERLYQLSNRHKNINFCWVPSHVGIPGNELADREAKSVINENIKFPSIPYEDVRPIIRSSIRKKWQDRWASPSLQNNKRYKRIRMTINHWPSSYHKNRQTEVKLSRLRIGHTRYTHQFILEGSDAPVCVQCALPLSVEHILVHC